MIKLLGKPEPKPIPVGVQTVNSGQKKPEIKTIKFENIRMMLPLTNNPTVDYSKLVDFVIELGKIVDNLVKRERMRQDYEQVQVDRTSVRY